MSDSSFKKSVYATQPMREFNVGEPEESPADIEQAVKEARKEKLAPRISPLSKTRVELLASIGRLTRDVKIGDSVFSLRTLKAREMREAIKGTFASVMTQAEGAYEARRQQIARALYKIDNADIDFVLGSDSIEDRIAFIEELEEVVVDALWDTFSALKKEAETKFGIKDENDAKEVLEDLKK